MLENTSKWDGNPSLPWWQGQDFHAFQCVWSAAKNKANYFSGHSHNFLDLPSEVVKLCAKYLVFDVYDERHETHHVLQKIVDNREARLIDGYLHAKYRNHGKVIMLLIKSIESLDVDTVSLFMDHLPRRFFPRVNKQRRMLRDDDVTYYSNQDLPESWAQNSNDSLVHFAIRTYNVRKNILRNIPSHEQKYGDILKKLLRPKYHEEDDFQNRFKYPFQNEQDETALHLACHHNDVQAVQILLTDRELAQETINLRSGDNFHHRTPYMIAYRDYQIASALRNNEFYDWRENGIDLQALQNDESI